MAAGLGFKTFTTGEVLTSADTNGYLMQGVLVFADAAARDAAITSPQEGQFAYLKDTNVTTYYTGSAWANLDTTGMTNPMTTTADMIYSSSGSTPARLGIGTVGQVLTVNSGATAPEWAAPSSGGLTVIDTSTVANTSTTLTISSIPATYKHLLVVGVGLQTSGANDGDLFVRVNGDSGNNYTLERVTVSGSTLAGYGTGSISGISNLGAMARTADGATLLGQIAIYIYNYSSSADYKTIVTSGGSMNNSTNSWVASRGMWRNTDAITSVSLVDANGTNLKAGTYITYGWN
jgi:hypothetical protein